MPPNLALSACFHFSHLVPRGALLVTSLQSHPSPSTTTDRHIPKSQCLPSYSSSTPLTSHMLCTRCCTEGRALVRSSWGRGARLSIKHQAYTVWGHLYPGTGGGHILLFWARVCNSAPCCRLQICIPGPSACASLAARYKTVAGKATEADGAEGMGASVPNYPCHSEPGWTFPGQI